MKLNVISGILVSALTLLSASAYANPPYDLTIVNHFGKPLAFTITINPDVLPDLQKTFTVAQADSVHTTVLEFVKRGDEYVNKESYIRVDDGERAHNAFWGVKVDNKHVKIYGYIGKGIAYSWKGSRVIFCTPEDYKKHHGCV